MSDLGDWKYLIAACVSLLAGSFFQSVIYPGTEEYGALDILGMIVAAVLGVVWAMRVLLRRAAEPRRPRDQA